MGIVEREDDDVTMEKLDKALGDLFEKKVILVSLLHLDDPCCLKTWAPGALPPLPDGYLYCASRSGVGCE